MTNKEYMMSQLAGLVGSTVIEIDVQTVGEDDEYDQLNIPVILFKLPNGKMIQLDIVGDAEGNCSAHIEAHKIT